MENGEWRMEETEEGERRKLDRNLIRCGAGGRWKQIQEFTYEWMEVQEEL
jgi:hypothetical protein